MSPESANHVDTPPWRIARLGPWPILEPLAKPALNFLFRGLGAFPPEVLTHQPQPCLEQIERRAKGGGNR
jgi:hypothetical protein